MEMVYPFVWGLKDTDGQHSERTNAFQLETDKKLKRKLMKQESEKKLYWKIVKKKWLRQKLNTNGLLSWHFNW